MVASIDRGTPKRDAEILQHYNTIILVMGPLKGMNSNMHQLSDALLSDGPKSAPGVEYGKGANLEKFARILTVR